MRGTTIKLIRRFVQHLIDNTKEGEVTKDKHTLTNELKVHWRTKGKQGQKFIKTVLNGKLSG